MALQLIPQVLPCGKPADLRLLGSSLLAGQTYNAGDVADGTNIVSGARYVVSGTPSSGTITYASAPKAIGSTFLGAAGQTSFNRSTSTVRLIRVETDAVAVNALDNSYYIVAGSGNDSVAYRLREYSPGDLFRAQGTTSATASGNAVIYRVASIDTVEILAAHLLGSRPIPGIIDNSSALGIENVNGAAIPAENLNRVYLWNFGSSPADVIIKAYNTNFDSETGATRRDWQFTLPANQQPWIWIPSEGFRQGAEGAEFGEDAEDRVYAQDAFIFQTASTNKNVWIKPEATEFYGLQTADG